VYECSHESLTHTPAHRHDRNEKTFCMLVSVRLPPEVAVSCRVVRVFFIAYILAETSDVTSMWYCLMLYSEF
jgi:hypothetical protein